MAQWHCASLENSFPQGYPGSIPGPGVFLFFAFFQKRGQLLRCCYDGNYVYTIEKYINDVDVIILWFTQRLKRLRKGNMPIGLSQSGAGKW